MNFGALILRTINKAYADAEANKPIKLSSPTSTEDMSVNLRVIAQVAGRAADLIEQHPGIVTALDDVFATLQIMHVKMAGPIDQVIKGLPADAQAVAKLLPYLSVLADIHAPTGGMPPSWHPGPGA